MARLRRLSILPVLALASACSGAGTGPLGPDSAADDASVEAGLSPDASPSDGTSPEGSTAEASTVGDATVADGANVPDAAASDATAPEAAAEASTLDASGEDVASGDGAPADVHVADVSIADTSIPDAPTVDAPAPEAAVPDATSDALVEACAPNPAACVGKACGTAPDGCGNMVPCGPGGSPHCATPTDVCLGGSCCSPESHAKACGNRCNTTVVDNCGQTVACACTAPDTCGGGDAGPNMCGFTCGGSGQPCCAGDACTAGGTVCSAGTCQPCGAGGQACCAGDACSSGSFCASGLGCVPCGAAGEQCCPGNSCSGAFEMCSGDRCVACGGNEQACCPSGPACQAGYLCDNGVACDTCLNPLPAPANCTQLAWVSGNFNASSYSTQQFAPQYAADGNVCTEWNSGTFAPDANNSFVWWQSTLQCYPGAGLTGPFVCPAVTHVGIVPAVSQTEDVTFFVSNGTTLWLGNVTETMADGQFLLVPLTTPQPQTFATSPSLGPIFYGVSSSPSSWVAVREIALFNCQ